MLPDIELQNALQQRLSADKALLALVKNIYDYYESEPAFPYIVIDEPTITDESAKNNTVFDYSVTVHMWHDQQQENEDGYSYPGNLIPMQIKGAVYKALSYRLLLPNYEVVRVRITQNTIINDVNDVYKHGILTYHFTLKQK